MPIIVSDTSPLSLLISIGQEGILPRMFGRVFVPSEVVEEMCDCGAPEMVRDFASALPEWITVQTPSHPIQCGLDPGESAAIALAIELNSMLLIDERKGRTVARTHGLQIIGAIGVLELGAMKGWIPDISRVHDQIRTSQFHISRKILEESLARIQAHDRADT